MPRIIPFEEKKKRKEKTMYVYKGTKETFIFARVWH